MRQVMSLQIILLWFICTTSNPFTTSTHTAFEYQLSSLNIGVMLFILYMNLMRNTVIIWEQV